MERLDKLLVEKLVFSSRARAEEAILSGKVSVDGQIVTKSGKKISRNTEISVSEPDNHYVSRGAFKLLHALKVFNIELHHTICMDLGASTGGFTQVLLENGCNKVYCVDVGTDQLHELIKKDVRIINLEQTHIKNLSNSQINEELSGIVIDVSFISLTKVLPYLPTFLSENGFVIALIKPQFEVGKQNLNKQGIVKDITLYPQVIEAIKSAAEINQFSWQGITDSPIVGGTGNKEFLCFLRKSTGMNI